MKIRIDDKKVRSGFLLTPTSYYMAICRKWLNKYSVNKFFPPTMALAGPVLQNCTKTDNTSSSSCTSTSTSSSTSSSSSSSSSSGHLGWVSLTSHEEILTLNLAKYSNIPPKRLWLLTWSSSLETGDITQRLGDDSAKVWLGRRCFTFTLFFPDDHYGWLQADNGWWIISSSHCSWIINCGESVKTGEKWIVS